MAVIQQRLAKDGTPRYTVIIRLKGCPTQTATFKRKTDAKKWIQDTESAIRDGRHFKTIEAKKHTLAHVVQRYINEVLPSKPKKAQQQSQQLLWWQTRIGYLLLAEITPAIIVQCRDELLNGKTPRGQQRSPATVVQYMLTLSHAFTIAVNEWQWLEANPLSKVKKPSPSRGRVRFLDDTERANLLAACKQSTNINLYLCVIVT